MNFTKTPTAASVVTAASFVASAAHIVKVVDDTNWIGFAVVYPIGIDGLIYVGIRAMQTGRKVVGALALLIGAAYSLAFNAHAEGAIVMSSLMIAASMPVCMFAAMLIETTANMAKVVEDAPAPAEPVLTVSPRAYVPTTSVPRAAGRTSLPIIPVRPSITPAPVRPSVRATVVRPSSELVTVDASTTTPRARLAAWDVEKAVALYRDGRTDSEVQSIVPVGAKPWQRTKRVIKLIEAGSYSVAEVAALAKVSELHVARVGKALER